MPQRLLMRYRHLIDLPPEQWEGDAMVADWTKSPYDVLGWISSRIMIEVTRYCEILNGCASV